MMERWFGISLADVAVQLRRWLGKEVLSADTLFQIGIIGFAALSAWVIAPRLRRLTQRYADAESGHHSAKLVWERVGLVMLPLCWLALQWLAIALADTVGWRHGLLIVTASLLSAWVAIRIASTLVRDPATAHAIASLAWILAALNILGLLGQTAALLDRLAIHLGSSRVSALAVIKGLIALAVLLWLASLLANVFDQRIRRQTNLTPSAQVLFSKLLKITLIAIAVVAAISSVGIDLTAFAVLGGAIGVGIGFGLQKIVSNLVSGVILLLDKSIKPGDVIAVANYYGRVDSLGARYVSVTTRDGIEHLIPNEELIINRVENWSHSNNLYRIRIPVGVHYNCDVPTAMRLCSEAAAETPRVLRDPKPNCLLRGFGDSAVDLEVRYWIDDPMNGRANVSSEIYLRIWQKFHEHGIEIPYPQRDLHLRTPDLSTAALAGLAGMPASGRSDHSEP